MKLGQYLFRKYGGKVVFFLLSTIAFLVFVHRNEQRLEEEAERALPGPLDASQPVG